MVRRNPSFVNAKNHPLTPIQDDREFQNKLSYEQRQKFKDSFNQFIRQRSETAYKVKPKRTKLITDFKPKKDKTINILLDKNFVDKLDDPFSVSIID